MFSDEIERYESCFWYEHDKVHAHRGAQGSRVSIRRGLVSRWALALSLAVVPAGCLGAIGDGEVDADGAHPGGKHSGGIVFVLGLERLAAEHAHSAADEAQSRQFYRGSPAWSGQPRERSRVRCAHPRVLHRRGALGTAGYADSLQRVAVAVAAEFKKTIAEPAFAASCFASEDGGEACAQAFVKDFGVRAFRRPIADEDVAPLLDVYRAGRDTGTDGDAADCFRAGLDFTVRAILQSPDFIYLTELGDPAVPNGQPTTLTLYETASVSRIRSSPRPPTASFSRLPHRASSPRRQRSKRTFIGSRRRARIGRRRSSPASSMNG